MRSVVKYYSWALLLAAVTACQTTPSNHLSDTYYTATQHIVLADVLPPPPLKNSQADHADLSAVLLAQKTRMPAQVALARADAELSVFRFQSVVGPQFTQDHLPFTAQFFKNVLQDEDRVVHVAKNHYGRRRPFIVSLAIKPIIPPLDSPAYPSGHATFAYITATLLAQVVPEKANALFERADEFAYNRVIAGVHYPSDVAAGRIAAAVIVHDLLQDPAFRTDLERVKREITQSRS